MQMKYFKVREKRYAANMYTFQVVSSEGTDNPHTLPLQPTPTHLDNKTYLWKDPPPTSLSLSCGSPFQKQFLCAVQRIKVEIYDVDS